MGLLNKALILKKKIKQSKPQKKLKPLHTRRIHKLKKQVQKRITQPNETISFFKLKTEIHKKLS